MHCKSASLAVILLSALILSCTTTKNMTPVLDLQKRKPVYPVDASLLSRLLLQHPEFFAPVLQNKEALRLQIIYTEINRNGKNEPAFVHHYYNVDPQRYFYPASTVKMPVAALALQRLNELAVPNLDRNTSMLTGAASEEQTAVDRDSTSKNGKPSIAHYIKKIFLVSDNDAYNRLYEFLGQEYVNKELHKRGYKNVQLLHRLQLSLTEEQNRATNPVSFIANDGKVLFQQPERRSALVYALRADFLGKGYLSGNRLVNEPFDFSKKNRITLPELHSILQSLIFPESLSENQRFNLTADDYRFLQTCMSTLPRESGFPHYDSSYSDAYVKFLLFGGSGTIENKSLRIFNKVGDAYGFLQDVAYVVDFDKGIEFFLSASIYCNSDGIFNDDKYDYDAVGFPFLKNLGRIIYEYEQNRPRRNKPDLSAFRMNYESGEE